MFTYTIQDIIGASALGLLVLGAIAFYILAKLPNRKGPKKKKGKE